MATKTAATASIDVFPSAEIAPVSKYLFSGFLEHLGRCIYGGILPGGKDTFPHTPRKPCPEDQFVPTPKELLTKEGFRADVLEVLRDELQMPMVRWPGGNYVQSYHWEDGVGPLDQRKRRPDPAWGSEESNQFGTNEFIQWCRVAKIEPFIILNMGTGSLAEALHWIEYCNGTGDTYYANLRRKHTGRDEPHNVKYWGLGNEVYGEWQVGQQTAAAYAEQARQWAHAIKLLDPSVILASCGEIGYNEWDNVVLSKLADSPKVQLHSIHLYTGFGPRDRSQKDKEFSRSVYGPEAAEYAIETCRSLINKALLTSKIPPRPYKIAFDEFGPWDETVGTPENGLEQTYTLTDALAMASWMNVFVRQADVVEIACNAQSVNVISPLMTSPTAVLKQPTFYPLVLFSKYMREGIAVRAHVNSPTFKGETLPTWIGTVKGSPKELDVSATIHGSSLRLAVVNRSETQAHAARLRFAFSEIKAGTDVEVHELWHADVKATNAFGGNENNVSTKTSRTKWDPSQPWNFREHSFTLLVLELDSR